MPRPHAAARRAPGGPGWRPAPVFAALGLLSALYFAITGTVWAVTGEFTRLGGELLALVGVDVSHWAYFANVVHLEGNPLTRTDGWIVIAMLLGSLLAALWSGDFRVRMPSRRRRIVQALGGGIIAGFGARLALGCNLAAMFTGIPQFSFHAWVFTVTTAAGSWVGVQIIRRRWWRGPTTLRPASAGLGGPRRADLGRRGQLVAGAVVLTALIGSAAAYLVTGHALLATAVLFGAAFGILIQRGQICFTAAFRDFWLVGQTSMMKALIIGLAVATAATFVVIVGGGHGAVIKPVGGGTVVGGLLFGLGIVLAGACETGMMYRAMQGQVQAALAFVGNIVGATFLAYAWDHLGAYDVLVAGSPKVDLLTAFGPVGALVATLAALGLWYAAVRRAEARRRAPLPTPTHEGSLTP